MQHGYKTQHSTVTALHTLNNTVSKWFNQMVPPARTITVALNISKDFDTINIHTLNRNLLQTNIPGTIIKFIANKERQAYIPYRNHTSRPRIFKTGVPQGGVLSPTLFNNYTSDLPPPSALVQVMAYTDDITITSTHTSTSAANKHVQPYLHKVFACTKHNNLHSVHSRPCRMCEKSGPQNTQYCTTHGNTPEDSGSYLSPKTHIQHTHPQHLKYTHTNLYTHGYLQDCYETGSGVCLFHMVASHPRPALTNCKSECSIENCHEICIIGFTILLITILLVLLYYYYILFYSTSVRVGGWPANKTESV